MHTRQKVITRTLDKEHVISTSTRQRKLAFSAENKNAELITSSARKTKCAAPKKNREVEGPKPLNTRSPSDGHQNLNKANGTSLAHKQTDVRDEQCMLATIFSPVFHVAKDSCDNIHGNESVADKISRTNPRDTITEESKTVEFSCSISTRKMSESPNSDCSNVDEPSTCPLVSSRLSDNPGLQNTDASLHSEAAVHKSYHEEQIVTGDLSPEVSAIYLAMQSSKLECADEPCHDSMSTDDYMEADEDDDEYGDFDPYLFIRNLPDLSSVVPTFRPMLLPKKTRSCPSTSLVLDLDETLVHSSLEPCEDSDFTFPVNFNLKDHTVYVRCRPYLKDFLERVSSLFEIIIFTASQSIYAEQLLNVLDPKRKLFRHRVYRESCVYVDGNYLKDLSILGRDLARVMIIDNSPQAFGFQVDNGIPIESWFDDRSDDALPSLLPFLESLAGVDDVRPLIAKKFNLRDKISGAAYPSLLLSKGGAL